MDSSMFHNKYIILFLTLALYIAGIVYYAVNAYSTEKDKTLARIDKQLLYATEGAQIIAGQTYHQRSAYENGIGKEEFLQVAHDLSAFAKSAGVKYVYSFIRDDGEVLFASTSLTDEEWSEEGETAYEENYRLIYDEATAALEKMFSKPQRLYEESRDQWGYFRSVLVPYESADGSIYIVGADIEISDVMSQMDTVLWSAVLTAFYYLGIILPFFIALLLMAKNDKVKLQALVDAKTEELQILNHGLEQRVADEIEKNREQEQLNFQQNKLAQMGEMVSMIAHQWRQPLAVLSAKASYMLIRQEMGKVNEEDVRQSNELVIEQCQTMSETINTFMNFVKPEQEKKVFFVRDSVDAVMQMMQAQFASQGISVEVIEAEKDVKIEGHENLFEQVVVNLLANARDAFESLESPDRKLTLTINKGHKVPVLSVEDNAGGIPEEIRDRIFNPYFTSKEEGKGTGIGLNMSKDIMHKSFDGELLYTPLGGGSRFEMYCCTAEGSV